MVMLYHVYNTAVIYEDKIFQMVYPLLHLVNIPLSDGSVSAIKYVFISMYDSNLDLKYINKIKVIMYK